MPFDPFHFLCERTVLFCFHFIFLFLSLSLFLTLSLPCSALPLSLSLSLSSLPLSITPMVLILGNSEIGAHVKSSLCYLICLRHLIRSRAITSQIFFSKKTNFLSYVRIIFTVTIKCKYHAHSLVKNSKHILWICSK